VLEQATRVLSDPDEDAFLKEVYNVGIGIEKCCNDLFEINLYSVGDNNSSDGKLIFKKINKNLNLVE